MSRSVKVTLIAAGACVGLLALIVVALLVFVNVNAYRPQIEAAASQATGMQVKVGGPLGIRLFPGLLLTMQDVHVSNQGAEIASATEVRLRIELLPLLHEQVHIDSIILDHPTLSIERGSDGKFNFSRATPGGALPALDISSISLADGTLHYADKQNSEAFEASSCGLQAHSLRLAPGKSPDLLKALSFNADLTCGDVRKNDLSMSDLKVSVAGKDGIFDIQPLSMQLFGAEGTGSMHADFSGAVTRYTLRYSLPQFEIAEFFKTVSSQEIATGRMDFSMDLSAQGGSVAEIRASLAGPISLQGKDLTLKGHDLDTLFSRFEASQHFNLVDVGAVFFVGPLGLVVTKGFNFADLLRGTGVSSQIHTLVSSWIVVHGVAQAQDVAMATDKNRIALRGGLDFVADKFASVTVALVDVQGCVIVQQKISGTFQNPVEENPSVVQALTGPVRQLLKSGRALFPGGKCEIFYAGSVAAPKA